MVKIADLRAQRASLGTEVRNLIDGNTGNGYDAEAQQKVEGIFAQIDGIDSQIKALERLANLDAENVRTDAEAEAGDRALHALTPEQRELQAKYKGAFRNFIAMGHRGLTHEESTLLRTGLQNAQSGQQANGSQGGYLVPTGFGGELLEALKSFGGMRNVAQQITTPSGISIPWPTVDDTASEGELVAENVAASSQDLAFGTVAIGARKWSSKIFTVPMELLQDQGPGIDIEAYIRKQASQRIARGQNRKYTVGTGVGEPTGLATAAVVGKVGLTGQTAAIISDDLVDLQHAVDPAYRDMPGVGWMFHDTTLRYLKKMKDSLGRPLWLPGFAVKEPDTILDKPYTINQHMATMAANARSILFGKLDEYLIRDVMEVTLFRFDDSAYVSKGQIGFLAWARGDGALVSGGTPVAAFQQSAS
jgi:HK97 family phage major capsid protein